MTQPNSPQWHSDDEVQRLIDEVRAEFKSDLESRDAQIKALQEQNAGLLQTNVPEHAGGPGTDIAPTWSQAEQEAARAAATA